MTQDEWFFVLSISVYLASLIGLVVGISLILLRLNEISSQLRDIEDIIWRSRNE